MGSSEKMMLSKDREKGMAANTPGRTNRKNKGPRCVCVLGNSQEASVARTE